MCLYKSSVDGVDLMEALFDRMFALPMIIQLFVIELYAVNGPKGVICGHDSSKIVQLIVRIAFTPFIVSLPLSSSRSSPLGPGR